MLKEVGKGVETILDSGETMDRKALVESLERSFQRHKTISILEGKMGSVRRRRKNRPNSLPGEEEEDTDSTPRKPSVKKGKNIGAAIKKDVMVDETGRVSQFMDADEADARKQVQQQIAAGVKLASFISFASNLITPDLF
jgi:cytokinesis protein